MKIGIVSVILVSIFLLSAACIYRQNVTIDASKNYTTRKVSIENSFHSLKVTGSPDVIYIQSDDKPSIEIYGLYNVVTLVEVLIDNGELNVRFKKNTNIRNLNKLEIRIKGHALRGAAVHGSGDISFPDGMKTNKLALTIQGSGDITGNDITTDLIELIVQGSGDFKLTNVYTAKANVDVAGSGNIYISGSSKDVRLKVAGSGDIHAAGFEAENIEARVAGSGNIKCHATKTLTGGVSGSGDVEYKGNPEISFSKKGLRKL